MKMSFKVLGSVIAVVSVLTVGCAHNRTDVAEEARSANEVEAAAQLNRSVVSTVAFVPGQKGLSPAAASEIQSALAEARKMGEIKTVEIVAWSDREYPVKGKALPKSQINLADERAKNVEKLVDQVEPSADVKRFNILDSYT